MDEVVDVIDKDNKILYQANKKTAHQKGLLHRAVVAEIRDSQGKWILVKQAADRQDAGQYVSPVGGHVSAGETEEEALKREALEEVGLKDFEFEYVGRVIYNRHVLGRQENHYFLLYEIFSDEPITLGPEAVRYKAFTEAGLKKQLKEKPRQFGDAFWVVIKKFYPYLLRE